MMALSPRITVLIPTFNRAEFLAECLESILGQTLKASQVIVVNDGSADGTKEALAPYLSRIDYVETPQIGKPGAINAVMEKVTGDYLWIFDDDDVALPEALERFVRPLEGHPEYGFSYSSFFFSTSDPHTGRIGKVDSELGIPDVKERGFLIPLLEWNFLGGAALFARMECYHRVGKFDERLLRSQDYEMAIRIARHFKGVRVEGGATFHYRQHEGARGSGKDRFTINRRTEKWFEYGQMHFRKNYGVIPLEDYLPPGKGLPQYKRQALLQRMQVMAYRHLYDELRADLKEISRHEGCEPFSVQEYEIIHKMLFNNPYQGLGALLDDKGFFKEVRALCRSSASMKRLRGRIARHLLRYAQKKPAPAVFVRIFGRLVALYV